MPIYTTLVIPESLSGESLKLLANKLRTFKLQALLSDPNAFSQSYATESRLPSSAWEARVGRSDYRIVVCIVDDRGDQDDGLCASKDEGESGSQNAKEHDTTVQHLVVADWAGTFTLVGPVQREDWLYPLSGQPAPGADGAETRWHLTSLFVLPDHRGRGLAGKLTLAAVSAGCSASRALSKGSSNQGSNVEGTPTRFRLIVHPKNQSVVGLYKKLGFGLDGMYTQREAMMAMGDAAGIPLDADSARWDTRSGIGMECLK